MPYISPSSAPPSPTGTSSAPPRAGPPSVTTATASSTSTSTSTTAAAGSAPVRRHGRHCSEPAVSFQRPSSSSYLHRHRRSPTIRAPVARLQQFEGGSHQGHQHQHQGLEAWTAPGTGMGLVLSPPESRSNSSDEEESKKLQAAQGAPSSTTSTTNSMSTTASDQKNEGSGNGILIYSVPEQATQTPEQSDQDEEEMAQKPPMLRKKSGELVRPAIRLRQGRPLSMPGTPTFSKAVHFGAQLEEVRHFMQLDRPLAVSAGSSPVEEYDGDTEFPFTCSNASCSSALSSTTPLSKDHWEARVTNFPSMLDDSRLNKPVRLRRIQLCPDTHALLGTVAVANISYSKHVSARFTLDNWKTVSEVTAEYVHADAPCIDRDERVGFDTFSFSIELADQLRHGMQNKTLFLCLRYNIGGREFWDNNDDMNYQIVFSRRTSNGSTSSSSGSSGSVGRDPLFRARMAKAKNARGGRAKPLSMVAMGMNLPMNMPIALPDNVKVAVKQQTQFEITASKPGDSDVDVDSEKEGWFPDPDSPTRKNKLRTNVFGDRYDFSASLTTSSSSASTGSPARYAHKHSHSMPHLNMVESSSASASASSPSTPSDSDESPSPAGEKRLSDFLSDRPNHQSQVYKELVDRYCFFGSTKSRRSGVSSKDGTGTEEVDEDASTPTMPMPMNLNMNMPLNMHHLTRRLSPGPGGHSPVSIPPPASTSTSPSDTEGLATPPASTSASTSVRPSFPFGHPRPASERGMPASPAPAPAPTAILG
ncbi:hypothetical protein H101_06879 [Trichophyton interdigitale H6]|nr:hypothetical protein H101_06879 [Trichophyton interdigitale H6]